MIAKSCWNPLSTDYGRSAPDWCCNKVLSGMLETCEHNWSKIPGWTVTWDAGEHYHRLHGHRVPCWHSLPSMTQAATTIVDILNNYLMIRIMILTWKWSKTFVLKLILRSSCVLTSALWSVSLTDTSRIMWDVDAVIWTSAVGFLSAVLVCVVDEYLPAVVSQRIPW